MGTAKYQTESRRVLHWDSLEQIGNELDRIEVADRKGELAAVGHWTPGQILTHLAAWIEYGYTGYPIDRPNLILRWLLRWMLPGFLSKGMRPGVRIPGIKAGTVGQEEVSTATGLQRYRAALKRLESGEPCTYDSPAFGPMSMADRVRLNIRHAELHLSFLRY
ncbi:MAG: DUF1569 domain-containing protein [Planctomycetota bacterium]|jgi:hypothetical protein|nr:DUF1569 domain-containing protein [Blastopirellula sp.]